MRCPSIWFMRLSIWFHGVLHAVSVNLVHAAVHLVPPVHVHLVHAAVHLVPPAHVHLVHAAPWGVHVLVHAAVHLVPLVHTAVHLNHLVPVVVHLVPLVHVGVHLLVVLVRPAVAHLVNVDTELVGRLLFRMSDLGLVRELRLSLGLPLDQGGVDGHGWGVEVVPAQSSSLGHIGQGGGLGVNPIDSRVISGLDLGGG